MARFSGADESVVHAHLMNGGVVFLSGQRRSGLTYYVSRYGSRMSGAGNDVAIVDLARFGSSEDLAEALRARFRLERSVRIPSDLVLALESAYSLTSGRCVVVTLNCHLAQPKVLDWLLEASLGGVVAGTGGVVSFLFEGALDIEDITNARLSGKVSQAPVIKYADFGSPWKALLEIEELARAVATQVPDTLYPWLADLTGGDLVLAKELLGKLPGDGVVTEEILSAAIGKVASGSTATALAQLMRDCGIGRDILELLVAGGIVYDWAPPLVRLAPIKALFLGGALSFDTVAKGYRVRSPLVARILAAAAGVTGPIVGMPDVPVARVISLLAPVAVLELGLRAGVARSSGVANAAAEIKTATPYAGMDRKITSEIMGSGIPPQYGGVVRETIARCLPPQESVESVIAKRLGRPPDSAAEIVSRLTLRELIAIAERVEVIEPSTVGVLERVASKRNDLAHFRGISYEEAIDLIRAIQLTFAQLRTPTARAVASI